MSTRHAVPWYRRTYRWGQTNLTEIDPVRYDDAWWRAYWRRTRVQGVIVNAGGIVAYYPSRYPLHHRAEYLGDSDLYGAVVAAAREEGLAVVARMDSNRADERFHVEHPDWFTVDADGRPYRAGDLYIACVNSPYYDVHLPDVLREVIERSAPDGFADNSWSGLGREHVCHCDNCRHAFKDRTGFALPRRADWDDRAYRAWIDWNYARRLEIWDRFNEVTAAAGGPDCLWLGMNSGDVAIQAERFRDHKAICERTRIFMLDYQARREGHGFQANGVAGRTIHGVAGWDVLIPESTALYGNGRPTFRLGSKPEPEVRLWALDGFASGVQPWWHHIGAYHEDRRQYRTAEALFAWHECNQRYLVDREPLATVGLVWSQRNIDFYGRDEAGDRTTLPARGVIDALIRARIPFVPVHADHVARDAHRLAALVLPNVAALSAEQCQAVREFVDAGGGLLATGETSRYDEWGDRRDDFGLADVFGAHTTGAHHGSAGSADPDWETWASHTYLRLAPGLVERGDGPRAVATVGEPTAVPVGERHRVLSGFDETDILPFGGRVEVVTVDESVDVPVTFVPPFPIYPPETSWMRQPRSGVAGLVLNTGRAGRVAYLPADLDRCFGRDGQPDHAALLENLVRWVARDRIPLSVAGAGVVDAQPYLQRGDGGERIVLHLVNLTNTGAAHVPLHEVVPVGPLTVRVLIPGGRSVASAELLVAGGAVDTRDAGEGWVECVVPRVADHEVLVVPVA